jgi:UDP-glucose 4-epimerase
MKVLVTGGAGYIGSTIANALLDQGHIPIILDSLVTGPRVFTKGHIFYEGDIADKSLLSRVIAEHPDIAATIHCAALIVVPESVAEPYTYYRQNVLGSLELFHNLTLLGQTRIVFSSSASIYDVVPGFQVTETAPLKPSSPYARTKYMMEMILEDLCKATPMRAVALRYFNPVGTEPKYRSGIHAPAPSHVLGKMVDVAMGKLPYFELTGTTWPTRDGSGIRDYVHVWDLAQAHVRAVERFDTMPEPYTVINLGSATGVTVKELLAAFGRVYGKTIPTQEAPPRPGDVAGAYANAEKAAHLLGWSAQHTIDQGIASALEWGERRQVMLGYK